MGQISVVALQSSSPKVTECFNVESRILCMAHVPPDDTQEDAEAAPETDPSLGKGGGTPTICLGMEDGRFVVVRPSITLLH